MSRQLAPAFLQSWSRAVVVSALIGLALPSAAHAVTAEELVALTELGLGDEVLIALVEATGTTTLVDAEVVARLNEAGVSQPVVLALIRASAPPPAATEAAAPPASQLAAGPTTWPTWNDNVTILGARQRERVIDPEIVVVPWVVGVSRRHGRRAPVSSEPYLPGYRGFGRFINDGFVDNRTRP